MSRPSSDAPLFPFVATHPPHQRKHSGPTVAHLDAKGAVFLFCDVGGWRFTSSGWLITLHHMLIYVHRDASTMVGRYGIGYICFCRGVGGVS